MSLAQPQVSGHSNTLLILDDERNICSALKRLFRADGYRVHTSTDADEAYDIVDKHDVDVIISDQRMPNCKGTEFLGRIQASHPQTVRLILSGFSDVSHITEAMDSGVIYKFLSKPWDDALLRANVREAFSRARSLNKINRKNFTHAATGIPTREYLEHIFEDFCKEATEQGFTVCLFTVHVEQIEGISAGYGNEVMEGLHKQLSKRIHNFLAGDCLIALDGDRYLVILKGLDPDQKFDFLSHRLKEDVGRTPLKVTTDYSFIPNFRIGGAFDPNNGLDFDTLLNRAHVAYLNVKAADGDRSCLFDRNMQVQQQRRLKLESDLEKAIIDGVIELYYQPQIGLQDGDWVGMEVLVRWPHAEFGMVSPGEFVPLAERAGLIEKLGHHILNQALRIGLAWGSRRLDPGRIAVNVSPLQLESDKFVHQLQGLLDRYQYPKHKLVIEVTENLALNEDPVVRQNLLGIADMGVGLSIDDFGSGHANLSNISRIPATELKIDKTLVQGSVQDERGKAILGKVVDMAKALNLQTVAEGIETPRELSIVHNAGCDIAQGYFFSPPVRQTDVEKMLLARAQPTLSGEN